MSSATLNNLTPGQHLVRVANHVPITSFTFTSNLTSNDINQVCTLHTMGMTDNVRDAVRDDIQYVLTTVKDGILLLRGGGPAQRIHGCLEIITNMQLISNRKVVCFSDGLFSAGFFMKRLELHAPGRSLVVHLHTEVMELVVALHLEPGIAPTIRPDGTTGLQANNREISPASFEYYKSMSWYLAQLCGLQHVTDARILDLRVRHQPLINIVSISHDSRTTEQRAALVSLFRVAIRDVLSVADATFCIIQDFLDDTCQLAIAGADVVVVSYDFTDTLGFTDLIAARNQNQPYIMAQWAHPRTVGEVDG